MEAFQQIEWAQVLTLTTGIISVALGLLIIPGKSMITKFLGLIFIFLPILIAPLFFPDTITRFLAVLPVCISLFFYLDSTFNIKSKIGALQYLLISMSVALLFLPLGIQFPGAIILFVVYVYLTLRLLISQSKNRGFRWFSKPGSRLSWIRTFLILYSLVISWYLTGVYINLISVSLSILFIEFFVIYRIAKESDFLTELPLANKYQKSTLNPSIKVSILNKITTEFEENKYYLNDSASLTDLAKHIGATTHHLSQVLNETMKLSFQELLSKYRMREATKLLRDEKNNTLKIENIAAKVGYNSKSSFNTTFKKYTGYTPSEYRSGKNVRTYREELLSGQNEPLSEEKSDPLNDGFTFNYLIIMIQNFIKVFIRNSQRNYIFTFINMLGLTVGLTCGLFIYVYIQDELSYDKSIPDHDQIYRIAWMSRNPQTRTPHPMAQALKNDLPEVEEAVSISPWYGPGLSKELIRVQNPENLVIFEEPGFYFVDSTFFDVFSIEVVEGDPNALSKPFTLIITTDMASKYFGPGENAVGRVLEINDMPLEVTTVVKPFPKNTHFHFNALIPYQTLKEINPDDVWMTWADFGHFNYLKVREGTDIKSLQSKIPEWVSGYLDWSQDDLQTILEGENYFQLQPITDIHLKSNLRWELEENGNMLYIYILSVTLIFILLIVTINYINLTTAKSIERAREIGIRKTFGAVKSQLKVQFFSESVFFTFIAMIFAMVLSVLLLGAFNHLTGKQFDINTILSLSILSKFLVCCLIVGIIAGFYPALTLSGFKVTEVLKGKMTSSTQGIQMRKSLVIVQFLVSAVLISGSLIIFQQVRYMQEKDLGFNKEAVISVSIPTSIEVGGIDMVRLNRVRNKIRELPDVEEVSMVSNLPGGQFNQHPIYSQGSPQNRIDASEMMVDFGFEKVLGLKVVKGRSFNPAFSSDTSTTAFMVNERLVSQLNLDNPVGQKIVYVGNDKEVEGTIIGVLSDFHYKSLHTTIQPLLIAAEPEGAGHLIIKSTGKNFSTMIAQVEEIYAELNSKLPFEYEFLDQQLASLYKREKDTLTVFGVFSGIALFLACLGLLGMAIATLNQRIKEVGIRKILGASSLQIIKLISAQFLILVGVALVIGMPLSYYLMSGWLSEFSYQVPFSLEPFIISVLILSSVAVLSVITLVIRIANANPADTLRYE